MSRDLALVAIIKDEGPVIFQWLAHHAVIGVQHFYLYDNGSTDSTRSEIAAFPEPQRITLIDWPMAHGQMPAYADALRRFGRRWRWMAFIDADEFFVLPDDDSILDVLRDFEADDGLAIPWCLFGSSGHDRRPAGYVVENYTRRAADDFPIRRHVKCIVQPDRIEKTAGHPHMFVSRNGRIVREDGSVMNEAKAEIGDNFVPARLRLHHYVVQSREDYEAKVRRGLATPASPRDARFFEVHDRNEIEDRTALRHVPAIRQFEARRRAVRSGWFGRLLSRF